MLNLNYKPIEVVDTDGMPNDEWLKYRTTGIGGSEVSAIYEVSGWTTKRALYYTKIGLDKGEANNQYTLDFGHWVEPFVAQWFQHEWENKYKSWLEKQMGIKIVNLLLYKDTIMYRHPLYPFMQANLDYRCRITDDKGKIYEGIFECKTTSHNIGNEKWDNKKVPYEYELQCRHYMSVMNLDFTIIGCLWGNNEADYRVRYIKRDLDAEEEMILNEKDFWENNVLAHNAPALSEEHAEQEMDAFNKFGIADKIKSGEITEINQSDEKLKKAISAYNKANEERKSLEIAVAARQDIMTKAKVEIYECLANEMDDNVKKQQFKAGDYLIKNNRIDKTTFDTAAFKEDYPDMFGRYKKISSYRKFSISEIEE